MPSSTFFNLPIDKQKKIIDAAQLEFSNHPYSEVSINKIIKNAEISRGSFYVYFADKYDLLDYLLSQFKNRIKNEVKRFSQEVNQQFKPLIILIHQHIFNLFKNEDNKKFLFNVIGYFQTHSEEEVLRQKDKLNFFNDHLELFNLIDVTQFKFNDKTKINKTIDISLAILKHVLYLTVTNNYNYQKSNSLLEEYLNILQYGYMEEQNA
ncbi:MAG: TetR/AcrR family transcriptional regulator [Candidatus Izemoplasmatales bacterium]|jgi:AcrR family transcriptional regulator|nr:TetR/AcrR family transcriptional regulator [Candidatus Izemoplasmatales bacterium]